MSIDDIVALHETLSEPIRMRLDLDGALFYAWVIPVALVLPDALLRVLAERGEGIVLR